MTVSTAVDPGSHASLVSLLRARATHTPDRTALIFASDYGATRETLTYAELDRRARTVAATLQASGGVRGERALLVFAPGFDFIAAYLGCLYAGVVAVPTYAPHPAQLKRSTERFLGVARDARPKFFLASSEYTLALRALMLAVPRHWGTRLVDTSKPSGDASRWVDPLPGVEDVAFLQYTSGSTSVPKGVVVTHGNLCHNLGAISTLAVDSPEARCVSWLPPYHDMGLIGGILQPLYAGFEGWLFSPLEFLVRPVTWLEALTRFGGTVSPFPNFALELCLRKVTDDDLDGLDLSRWSVAINGAEPIHARTLERFAARFEACGFRSTAFRPVYGLAEGTLLTTCVPEPREPVRAAVSREALAGGAVSPPVDAADRQLLVSCGASVPGQDLAIVDADRGERLGDDQIGEIWLSGPSVARGYWQQEAISEEAFGARIAGDERRWLRTGDLGFLRDGELYVTGRRKDLIILRGRNHYPQDLERAAEAVDGVRGGGAAAFAITESDGERAVLVAEVGDNPGLSGEELEREVRAAVRRSTGVDLHAVVLVQARSLPKTSSGKIRRFEARRAYSRGRLKVAKDLG